MKKNITVFIPTYNNQTTILDTLNSLSRQKTDLIRRVIIMDDGSTDKTIDLIASYKKKSRLPLIVIENKTMKRLSQKYNWIIDKTTTPLLIIMHADIVIKNSDAIEQYLHLMRDKKNVAATSFIAYDRKDWEKYSFWQKCEFDRLIDYPPLSGLTLKFDMFRTESLKKVGRFDTQKFDSAGEISDIIFKLEKIGNIAKARNIYIHRHSFTSNYTLGKVIYRQARISEAQGTTLRTHLMRYDLKSLTVTFFREIMFFFVLSGVILFFIFHNSSVAVVATLLLSIYSFLYTKNTFLYCFKDPRIVILPLVNIILILVSCYYTFIGFFFNKQRL